MAIKSGRVGVREDQVDVHGRIIATDYLVAQIKEKLENLDADSTDSNLPVVEVVPPVEGSESN